MNLTIDQQDTVNGFIKAIQEAINELQLKAADYSKVDKMIEQAKSIVGYKYTSIANLQIAIENVLYGKDITMQGEVDAYASDIENALATLTLKETSNAVEGINETITDLTKPLVITILQGDVNSFMGVYLNGVQVDKSYYSMKTGSIVLEFTPAFLSTMASGSHTLDIVTTDIVYSTNFIVDTTTVTPNDGATITPGEGINNDTNQQSPSTGDTTNVILYVAIFVIASVSLFVCKKRKIK